MLFPFCRVFSFSMKKKKKWKNETIKSLWLWTSTSAYQRKQQSTVMTSTSPHHCIIVKLSIWLTRVVGHVSTPQDPKDSAAPNDPATGYGGGRACCDDYQLSIALYATCTARACSWLLLWFIHLHCLQTSLDFVCVCVCVLAVATASGVLRTQK